MRKVIGLVAGVLMASPVLAGWRAEGASSNPATVSDVSCADITGELGILTDWSVSSSQYELTSDAGEVGAKWTQQYYPNCTRTQVSTTCTVVHKWGYQYTGKGKIRVQLTASTSASGYAVRCSSGPDPENPDYSWWWNPTVNINDSAPSVKRYNEDDEFQQEYGFPSPADGYDHIDVGGTGGQGQGNPPGPFASLSAGVQANGSAATSGTFDGTTNTISGSTGDYLEVVYTVNASAQVDADNAAISMNHPWKVFLQSTVTSTGTN
jgi:hypothetical protein